PPTTIFDACASRPAVAARALPITASASIGARAIAHLRRALIYRLLLGPLEGLQSTGRYLVKDFPDSRSPRAFESLTAPANSILGRPVPNGVGPGVSECAVVGEDLEVVEALPAGSLEC